MCAFRPMTGCSSFQFYIKPQRPPCDISRCARCFSFQFYIKPQQIRQREASVRRCFSFQFYIKPQLKRWLGRSSISCFSFQFYIKPQQRRPPPQPGYVVSHSNSTSNHNLMSIILYKSVLFLIPILHQTTTREGLEKRIVRCFSFQFYIKPQHSSSANYSACSCFSFQFYIKPQQYRP